MAGYVVKIVLEDTHPPVWRRLIIPNRISFADLHEIIQAAFGWDGSHLAEFSGPSYSWHVESDEKASIDEYFRNGWMRYIYDFGEDWCHKIILEKIDDEFVDRFPVLIKYKGDGFQEDSGGVFGNCRVPFDRKLTECKLEGIFCDESKEELDEMKRFMNFIDYGKKQNMEGGKINKKLVKLKKYFDTMLKAHQEEQTEQMSFEFEKEAAIASAEEKIKSREKEPLQKLSEPKTVAQLLEGLTEQQAQDYCKFLCLDVKSGDSTEYKANVIAAFWHEHPEYLLYVLDADEFSQLENYVLHKSGKRVGELGANTILKAVSLGLVDAEFGKMYGEDTFQLEPATDVKDMLEALVPKKVKEVYRKLEHFSSDLSMLILFYGLIDFDNLYEAYCRINKKPLEYVEFERCVYWHAQFNGLIRTCENRKNHTHYAQQTALLTEYVLDGMDCYAKNLPYKFYPKDYLKAKSQNLNSRSIGVDSMFSHFCFGMGLEEEDAGSLVQKIFEMVMNGLCMEDIIDILYQTFEDAGFEMELQDYTAIWEHLASMMIETELPMLKGRNRIEYGEEMGVSEWSIDMLKNVGVKVNPKDVNVPIYKFPQGVQEKMHCAAVYGHQDALKWLIGYKKKSKICSEQFICILAEACIMQCEKEYAAKLIDELNHGSKKASRAAAVLTMMLEEGMDIMDDFDVPENYMDFDDSFDGLPLGFDWRAQRELDELEIPETFVRETKKVGRNEPCPCGSGKKYKNCCGKYS